MNDKTLIEAHKNLRKNQLKLRLYEKRADVLQKKIEALEGEIYEGQRVLFVRNNIPLTGYNDKYSHTLYRDYGNDRKVKFKIWKTVDGMAGAEVEGKDLYRFLGRYFKSYKKVLEAGVDFLTEPGDVVVRIKKLVETTDKLKAKPKKEA